MKTKFLNPFVLLFVALGIFSCKKSSNTLPTNTNVTFLATLNGASETPPNSSMATGSASFIYDPTTYVLSGTVSFTGITPTASHIHKGAVGIAGGVIFPLTGSGTITSPISFTSVALDATQQADLMANLYYVNIHSTTFPGGEIRGQLVKQVATSGY
jgi:hypothetical protein